MAYDLTSCKSGRRRHLPDRLGFRCVVFGGTWRIDSSELLPRAALVRAYHHDLGRGEWERFRAREGGDVRFEIPGPGPIATHPKRCQTRGQNLDPPLQIAQLENRIVDSR